MKSKNIEDRIELVNNFRDLSGFIHDLRYDLINNTDEWKNQNLDQFLDSMSAWVGSMDQLHKNLNIEFSEEPSWKTFANILYASKLFE